MSSFIDGGSTGSASLSGPTSAYGGRGPLVLGITWTEFAIATTLLGFRVYTRYKITKYAGWALIWAGLAWLWGVVIQSLITVAVAKGFGNHLEAVFTAGTVTEVGKWAYLSGSLVLVSIGLSKISVVAFLIAIIGVTKRKQRWLLIFIAVTNMAIDLAQLFWAIFRCNPVEKDWNIFVAGSCYSEFGGYEVFADFIAAYSAFSDFLLALYPILLLWNLQMAIRVKVGLCALMALGCLAGVCGIMRAITVQDGYNTTDPTYDGATTILWVWTEMWLVIIASSVPPLWPLLKRFAHKIHTSLGSSRGGSRGRRQDDTPRSPRGAPSGTQDASDSSDKESAKASPEFGTKEEQKSKLRWGGFRRPGGTLATMPEVNKDSLGVRTELQLGKRTVDEEKGEGGSAGWSESEQNAAWFGGGRDSQR